MYIFWLIHETGSGNKGNLPSEKLKLVDLQKLKWMWYFWAISGDISIAKCVFQKTTNFVRSSHHIIRWGWFAFFSWSRVRLHSRNISWEIFLKNDEWKKQQQQQETNQIVSSWTNITAVKMAEIITKRVSFEIEISVWRSPLFSILFRMMLCIHQNKVQEV